MLYLSRLLLNNRSSAVRRDLADCHQLHRTILAAFPEAPDGTAGARAHFGVLYRMEMPGRDGNLRLLVQARSTPNWTKLPADYLDASAAEPSACKRVDEHFGRLQAGTELIFRLRANPTRRIDKRNEREGERWRGRRVELRREEDQMAWLQRKGAQGGFVPTSVRVNPAIADVRTLHGTNVTGRRPLQSPAQPSRANSQVTFGSVLFDGRLRIADAERFRHTLEHGIGSGKAYGFGLLSVMAAPESP